MTGIASDLARALDPGGDFVAQWVDAQWTALLDDPESWADAVGSDKVLEEGAVVLYQAAREQADEELAGVLDRVLDRWRARLAKETEKHRAHIEGVRELERQRTGRATFAGRPESYPMQRLGGLLARFGEARVPSAGSRHIITSDYSGVA